MKIFTLVWAMVIHNPSHALVPDIENFNQKWEHQNHQLTLNCPENQGKFSLYLPKNSYFPQNPSTLLKQLGEIQSQLKAILNQPDNETPIEPRVFVESLANSNEYEMAHYLLTHHKGVGLPTNLTEQLDFLILTFIDENPGESLLDIIDLFRQLPNGINPHLKFWALEKYLHLSTSLIECVLVNQFNSNLVNLNTFQVQGNSLLSISFDKEISSTLKSLLETDPRWIYYRSESGRESIRISSAALLSIENEVLFRSLGSHEPIINQKIFTQGFIDKYLAENPYYKKPSDIPSVVRYDIEKSVPKLQEKLDELTALKLLKRSYLEQLLLHKFRLSFLSSDLDSPLLTLPYPECTTNPEIKESMLGVESVAIELSRALKAVIADPNIRAGYQLEYYNQILEKGYLVDSLQEIKKRLNGYWFLYLNSYCMSQKDGLENGYYSKQCIDQQLRNYEIREDLNNNIKIIDENISQILNLFPELILELPSGRTLSQKFRNHQNDIYIKSITLSEMRSDSFSENVISSLQESAQGFLQKIDPYKYTYSINQALSLALEHNREHTKEICASNNVSEMRSLTQAPSLFWGRASPLFELFLKESHPEISEDILSSYGNRLEKSFDTSFQIHETSTQRKEFGFAALSLGGGILSVASFFLLPGIGVPISYAMAISTGFSMASLAVDTHYYYDYIIPKYNFGNNQYHSFNLYEQKAQDPKSSENESAYLELLISQPLPLGSYEKYQEVKSQYKWEKIFYYGGLSLELVAPLKHIGKTAKAAFNLAEGIIGLRSPMYRLLPRIKNLSAVRKASPIHHFLDYIKLKGIDNLSLLNRPENFELATILIYAYVLDHYDFETFVKYRLETWEDIPGTSSGLLLDTKVWEKIKLASNYSDSDNEKKLQDYSEKISRDHRINLDPFIKSSLFEYLVVRRYSQ